MDDCQVIGYTVINIKTLNAKTLEQVGSAQKVQALVKTAPTLTCNL